MEKILTDQICNVIIDMKGHSIISKFTISKDKALKEEAMRIHTYLLRYKGYSSLVQENTPVTEQHHQYNDLGSTKYHS